MLERIKNNPAMVVNTIVAAIALIVAFGIPVSEDQKVAVVGVVSAVLALVGGVAVRSQVRPTRKDATDDEDEGDLPVLEGDGAEENDTTVTGEGM